MSAVAGSAVAGSAVAGSAVAGGAVAGSGGGEGGEALTSRGSQVGHRPHGAELGSTRAIRRSAVVFGVGGLLLAVGGLMHPHETDGTMEQNLLALLGSPAWLPAHAVLLVGMFTAVAGLVLLRRHDAFAPGVRPWLTGAIVAWGVAAPEFVPHLLAGSEHHAFATGGPTPMVDTHLALSLFTNPLVGIAGALLAVAVARTAGTWPARALAALAVVGGLVFSAAAPLLLATGYPAMSNLFAMQALLDVWIIGTSLRLVLGPRTANA
jgi:hypothetical protein